MYRFQQPPTVDANQTERGLMGIVAQIFAGAKTFLALLTLSGGLVVNGTVNQMIKVSPPATVSGRSFTDPVMWFETITGQNQTNLIQIGSGLTSTTWEFAIGYYGGALAPLISSRASTVYFSAPVNNGFAPFTPNTNDLGSASNYWRNVHAGGFFSTAGSVTLQRSGGPLFLYAAGTSGLYDTVRLVSSRQDAGLVCVSVGTELGAPTATTILFQVAHTITTAATLAGSGTGVFKVFGDGNITAGTTNGFTLSGAGTTGTLAINNSVGISFGWNGLSIQTIDSNGVTSIGNVNVTHRSNAADGASAVAVVSRSTNAWVNATAKLHTFLNAAVEKAAVYADGSFQGASFQAPAGASAKLFSALGAGTCVAIGTSHASPGAGDLLLSVNTSMTAASNGTPVWVVFGNGGMEAAGEILSNTGFRCAAGLIDESATPGNCTIDAFKGRAALNGTVTNTIVVTNSYVTEDSVVMIAWEPAYIPGWNVIPGAGFFTITTDGTPGFTAVFRFLVF